MKGSNNFQNEKLNFTLSPYGVAKLYAHWITKNYRGYNILHVMEYCLITKVQEERNCNQKIISALCKIKVGKQKKLFLVI